ncbi:MAG: polysaccharide lyase [Cupriavidus sp.]|nr:polysaccharide lyase [Cupriavidus sp.]
MTAAAMLPDASAEYASQKLRPGDVFDTKNKLIYRDDFRGDFRKWTLSIDAQYDPESRPITSDRVTKEAAPGLTDRLAVKFLLPGTPGSFRSELAIPAEEGLQERWYGVRMSVDQTTDAAGYIVLQWHAVMGNDKVDRNFPNLAIQQKRDRWVVARAWGQPDNIQRSATTLPRRVEPGKLTSWVIHAKWATDTTGVIEIWQDGALVYRQAGQNAYSLSSDRTPYMKTGIYRPSRKGSTTTEAPVVVRVSDVRIARADGAYPEVAPVISATLDKWNGRLKSASTLVPVEFARDAGYGAVGFVVPPQPGVAGAPSSLVLRPGFADTSMFAVDLINRSTGEKGTFNLRGFRHAGCIIASMNVALDCGAVKLNFLEISYDQEDNREKRPGLYEGKLLVEARSWMDRAYRRPIEINLKIYVTPYFGELRKGTTVGVKGFGNRVKQGTVGFFVPPQMQASGPASVDSNSARDSSKIRVIATHEQTGAPYPVVARGRRYAGECGTFRMNSTAPCGGYDRTSDLELEYRPSDNADLPAGKFLGSALIHAQGGYETYYVEPIALGLVIEK